MYVYTLENAKKKAPQEGKAKQATIGELRLCKTVSSEMMEPRETGKWIKAYIFLLLLEICIFYELEEWNIFNLFASAVWWRI